MTTKEKAQLQSTQVLKADNIVFLPVYIGRRKCRITIKNVLPEIEQGITHSNDYLKTGKQSENIGSRGNRKAQLDRKDTQNINTN